MLTSMSGMNSKSVVHVHIINNIYIINDMHTFTYTYIFYLVALLIFKYMLWNIMQLKITRSCT